jgi:hypothetical protein
MKKIKELLFLKKCIFWNFKKKIHILFFTFTTNVAKKIHTGAIAPLFSSCCNHYYQKNTRGTSCPPLLIVATIATKLKHKGGIMPPLFLLM